MTVMTLSSAKRAAYGGLFTAVSMIFSYLETLIPLQSVIPVPGFKLGLANICIMLAIYLLGTADAFIISLARIALSSLLFGTPTTFLFSLGGGLLSFGFLLLAKYVFKDRVTYIGISVGSAAMHNVGQICVAALFFKDTAVFWYLEWLLPVSVITGIVTGIAAMYFGKAVGKKL